MGLDQRTGAVRTTNTARETNYQALLGIVITIVISTLALPTMANSLGALEKDALEKMAHELEMHDRNAKEAETVAKISPVFVGAPLGRWALLRKGTALCAVRFTAFGHERGKDNLPARMFKEIFFANYDWYYQEDGGGDFTKSNVKSGHGEANIKPNLWRFETSKKFIKCGSIKAQWWYPNSIFLINRNYRIAYDPKISDQPNDVEIALTGWKNIKDVNAQDTRLVWYRYDTQRDPSHNSDEPITIPIGRLSGFE